MVDFRLWIADLWHCTFLESFQSKNLQSEIFNRKFNMAWISITEDLVKTRLTGPELTALKSAATASGQTGVLADVISGVVKEWRGRMRRWHTLAAGSTVPDELEHHVLAMVRYRLFTRLPGMKGLLDELRVREYDDVVKAQANLEDMVFEAATTPETTAAGVPAPSFNKAEREMSRDQQAGL